MRSVVIMVAALLASSPAGAFWSSATVDGTVAAVAGDDSGVRVAFECKGGKLGFNVTLGFLNLAPPYREAELKITADGQVLETLRLTPTRTDKGRLLLAVPSEETAMRLATAALAAKSHFASAIELGGGNRASTQHTMTGALPALTAVFKACNRPLPG